MLWFLFFLLYSFITAEKISVTQTQGDPTVDLTNDKNILSAIMEQCSCDLVKGVCEPYCCCDNDCDENLRDSWKNEEKCIDEETTAKIQSYHCINSKLLVNFNKRRGIQEDKSDEKKTCYSKDNDESGDNLIENLSKKDSTKLQNLKDSIYNDFKKQIPEGSTSSPIPSGSTNGLIFAMAGVNNPFVIDNVFSLFSRNPYGECVKGKGVRFYEPIPRYYCIVKDEALKITLETFESYNIKPGGTVQVSLAKKYFDTDDQVLADLDLSIHGNKYINDYVFTIELQEIPESNEGSSNTDTSFVPGSISRVVLNVSLSSNPPTELGFNVRFNQTNKKAYPYSGNVGYLIGYPLKIAFREDELFISYYDGFVVKGRSDDGSCIKFSGDKISYAYPIITDKPILFGVDFDYSCTYQQSSCNTGDMITALSQYLLFKTLMNIRFIGRAGASKMENSKDWIFLNTSMINEELPETIETDNKCTYPKSFIFKLYYREIGPENEKQYEIYNREIAYETDTKENINENPMMSLHLKVQFIRIPRSNDDSNLLTAKEDTPTIMPRLPKDLIDPITKPES